MKKVIIACSMALLLGVFIAPGEVLAIGNTTTEIQKYDDNPNKKDAAESQKTKEEKKETASTEKSCANKEKTACTKSADKSSCSKAKDSDGDMK